MSRQAISLFKDGARGKGGFPSPVQRIKNQLPLWDWADVAEWLADNGRINARILSKWNLALRASASKDFADIVSLSVALIERRRSAS